VTVAEFEPPPRAAESGALAVYFDRRAGQATVTGGLGAALLFALAAGVSEIWILTLGIPVGLLVAFHHLAMLRGVPQLVISDRGLYVDGIGLVAWEGVAEVQMVQRSVRTLANTSLYMLFEGPIRHAIVAPAFAGGLRRLQIMVWDAPDPDLLVLKLAGLDVDAEALMDAMEHYWTQARRRKTGRGTGPGPKAPPTNPRDGR
jgi:hypothetical protein